MLAYDFAVQTLVQTLLDLGVDYFATYDGYGPLYVNPNADDQWVNASIQQALSTLIAAGPVVGTRRTRLALSVSPLRMARVLVWAVPGGYVAAVLTRPRGLLSAIIARKLANAIENWIAQRYGGAPQRWSR